MIAMLDSLRQRAWSPSDGQPVRVFVALAGLLAVCGANDGMAAVIPLYLGVIANVLSETDDGWRGRVRAQLVTLLFFAAASGAVLALAGRPAAFALAIAAGTFCLTMMGALPARYKQIGFATIVMAVYAVIVLDGHGQEEGLHGTLLLLAGSTVYGVLSVAWSAAWPAQPVQSRLARLLEALGHYMIYKASLFEPLRGIDVRLKRLSLARLNAGVVAELNETKDSLVRRQQAIRATGRLARYRGLYLIAQDVHERASSSHDDYNALADAFFHSDLLYRCQRVLMQQGNACADLADSVARHQPFVLAPDGAQALAELRSAIAWQRALPQAAERAPLLASIESLADNLALLEAQLAGAQARGALVGRTDLDLADSAPHTLRAMVDRVRRQLTPGSALLRHALRLSIALALGYAVNGVLHPVHGDWIMMTTLFVCRQNYGETVARLGERTTGTIAGVLAGWALLQLFPQPLVQASLAVVAGVLFSATRISRYGLATAAITVLVLLCANQVGHGAVLMLPRLVDTLIGCAIAWAAVSLVFPHWASGRFNELAANALRGYADYLVQAARQYRDGASDDLPYRVARRRAHDADAALATAVSDMYREPDHARPNAGAALRFMIQAHTLLAYISALGAHRAVLANERAAAMAEEAAAVGSELQRLAARFTDAGEASPAAVALPAVELPLVRGQLAELHAAAGDWLAAAQ
jgi:YccS/YhfK family integral membrane protein